MYANLTSNENFALTHYSRFGSDGYPVSKLGRKWQVRYPEGAARLCKTKREAWAAWEAYIELLIDRAAGRL